jgi:hypothetical protein
MKPIPDECEEKQTAATLSQLARLRFDRKDEIELASSSRARVWTQTWATIGAAAWAVIAVLARLGIARLGEIELLFLFAPLVIVPLGMELGRATSSSGWFAEAVRRAQPMGALLAVWAMLTRPGLKAGLLALGWMTVCLLAAGSAVGSAVGILVRPPGRDAGEGPFDCRSGRVRATCAAVAIARIDLAVGGAWFVASRLGMRPMGIHEPIGLLTAVHFHYAGFATATIAAATLRFGRRARSAWFERLVWAIAGLPYVVAVGFVVSPILKMSAAILFSVSVAVLAIFLRAYGTRAEKAESRVLLHIAAGAVFAAMIFSGVYAVTDFAGSSLLTIPEMARTHGILNAMGFCLCGLLGWLVESDRSSRPENHR